MAAFINNFDARMTKTQRPRINRIDSMTSGELYKRYRFNREGLQFVFDTFSDDLAPEGPQGGHIYPEIQIISAIQYFASNSLQLVLGDAFGMCQHSQCIKNVARVIAKKMLHA